MLKYFKDNDLVLYPQEQPATWEEAIRISCKKLIEKEIITDDYVSEIIESVNTNGPYIVIIPQVAMPHAAPDSDGVLGTGISFTKFPEEVVFYDKNVGEEKPATLFFTLAAKNSEEHLKNIMMLTDLLQDDEIIGKLIVSKDMTEFESLIKY